MNFRNGLMSLIQQNCTLQECWRTIRERLKKTPEGLQLLCREQKQLLGNNYNILRVHIGILKECFCLSQCFTLSIPSRSSLHPHASLQVPTPTLSQHATCFSSQSSRRSVGNSVSRLGEAIHQAVSVGENKTDAQTGRSAPWGQRNTTRAMPPH